MSLLSSAFIAASSCDAGVFSLEFVIDADIVSSHVEGKLTAKSDYIECVVVSCRVNSGPTNVIVSIKAIGDDKMEFKASRQRNG